MNCIFDKARSDEKKHYYFQKFYITSWTNIEKQRKSVLEQLKIQLQFFIEYIRDIIKKYELYHDDQTKF